MDLRLGAQEKGTCRGEGSMRTSRCVLAFLAAFGLNADDDPPGRFEGVVIVVEWTVCGMSEC